MKHIVSISSADELKVFKWVRFPLIVGIVYLHNIGKGAAHLPEVSKIDIAIITQYDFYNLFRIVFSGILPLICVPFFFFMSGYLFFLKDYRFDYNIYKKKINRRLKSLVVPYFLWNLIALLSLKAKDYISLYLSGEDVWEMKYQFYPIINSFFAIGGGVRETYNWFGFPYYHSFPINDPLWFLRDLIILSLLTPVIWWLLKHMGGAILLILFIPMLLQIMPYTPREDIKGLFYFTLGAYYGIKKIDIHETFKKYKKISIFTGILFALLCLYYFNASNHIDYTFQSLYILTGIVALYEIVFDLIKKWPTPSIAAMSSTVFFIYGLHRVYPLGLDWNFGLNETSPVWMLLLSYIGCSLLKIVVCLIIYFFLKKISPSVINVLTGGR